MEEKLEHGTYTAEFVEGLPLPPVGEDRKTILILDTAPSKLLDASAATLGSFSAPS